MKQHQDKMLPIDVIKENKVWFEYLFDPQKPTESKYRCRLCYKHYDELVKVNQYKNALAFKHGMLKADMTENRKTFKSHANIPGHKSIVDQLIAAAGSDKRIKLSFEAMKAREDRMNVGNLAVTANMFRTVYVETKKHIPFDSHASLVALQKENGANLGFHHSDRRSIVRMVESMSNFMHEKMIEHMLSKNSPFSIIIDGSDLNGLHYLIVYFQVLENNTPVVAFYRLIQTSSDITGEGLFKVLKNAIIEEKHDLFSYFKKNLIGYSSDGAYVMTGPRKGLISYIRRMKNNDEPVFAIHCMAHRLHLAIKSSFKSNDYFKLSFDKLINDIYHFYNFHSTKRKAHLSATAQRLNLKVYAMNYVYRVRWISS